MLLFARKRIKDGLVNGAPLDTIFRCQDKDWMDCTGFYYWLSHFTDNVKSSQEKEVLLVLDGYSSHTQTLQAIELASYAKGVILLSFPS